MTPEERNKAIKHQLIDKGFLFVSGALKSVFPEAWQEILFMVDLMAAGLTILGRSRNC